MCSSPPNALGFKVLPHNNRTIRGACFAGVCKRAAAGADSIRDTCCVVCANIISLVVRATTCSCQQTMISQISPCSKKKETHLLVVTHILYQYQYWYRNRKRRMNFSKKRSRTTENPIVRLERGDRELSKDTSFYQIAAWEHTDASFPVGTGLEKNLY